MQTYIHKTHNHTYVCIYKRTHVYKERDVCAYYIYICISVYSEAIASGAVGP